MKQNALVLLFLFSLFPAIFGQNYQTINPKKVVLFENPDHNVRAIRIDSVKVNGDSILFPFTVIQQLDYNCYSPTIASWIGQKVINK